MKKDIWYYIKSMAALGVVVGVLFLLFYPVYLESQKPEIPTPKPNLTCELFYTQNADSVKVYYLKVIDHINNYHYMIKTDVEFALYGQYLQIVNE
jgi:hypothetical protein